jgi:hypothetical protein
MSMATTRSAVLDRLDEQRAVIRRSQLGQARWLVSWLDDGSGRWLARLSGPGCEETIETLGRSRFEAIAAAEVEATRQLRQRTKAPSPASGRRSVT